MKSKEKIKYIEEMVDKINNQVLKNKTWKIEFNNQLGANNYCLIIEDNIFSFNTYDSLISCLNLLKVMFSKALNERKK